MRWAWVAIAVIGIVGASGAAVAKEKSKQSSSKEKSKAETPATETGNGSGYIGVYLQELTDNVRKGLDIKADKGVLVSGVEDDAPAARAGIEEGDVIVSFNGTAVSSPGDLQDAVRAVSPGKDARVEVMHDGKSRTLTLTVSERPERSERHSFHWDSDDHDGDFAPMVMREIGMGGPRLGIQAQDLEDDGLASYFGAKKGDGVLVLSVDDESVAGKAGVKPGDIISRVGKDKITDTGDVHRALGEYDKGDQFDITVLRHGKSQSLKATMDDQDHQFAFRMGPESFHWHGATPHAPGAPRVFIQQGDRDDLRRELDDLKQQIKELKEELEQRNDG
jgi:C-terminal processing protease CtpA/Prc